MTQPPAPQVVYKPGGLSGAAHAVHILICFFTCGLWIPGYLLFLIFTPSQRVEVVVPIGADPEAVAAAYAAASPRRSQTERKALLIAIGAGVGSVLLVVALTFVLEPPGSDVTPAPSRTNDSPVPSSR